MDSFLESVSQLGVAFAGFTGVAAVLGRHASGDWQRADVLRFWQMLEISLLLVIVPLLPAVTSPWLAESLGVLDAQLACLVLLIISALQMTRAGFRTLRARLQDPTISVGFTVTYLILGAVVLLLQAYGATGLALQLPRDVSVGADAIFRIGVFWHVGLASVLFWRLMKHSGIPLPQA